MLNNFFGLLADSSPEVAENFIKDRFDWLTFNGLAIKAASKNPALLPWIWELAGAKDLFRWLGNYLNFTRHAVVVALLNGWFPAFLKGTQGWLEPRNPALWLRLSAINFAINTGKPPAKLQIERTKSAAAIQKPEII